MMCEEMTCSTAGEHEYGDEACAFDNCVLHDFPVVFPKGEPCPECGHPEDAFTISLDDIIRHTNSN